MFEQDYIQFSIKDDVFSTKVFPPSGKIEKPVREAEKTAYYFYKKYKTKKLVLCMSGGLDSEVMAESFLRAGAPFQVSIWRFKHGSNDYDIKHAIHFCKKHKLDYEIEICNLNWFYVSKMHGVYCKKYLCNSPQVAVHLYMLEKLFKEPNIAVFLPWQAPHFYYNSKLRKAEALIIYFRYLAYYRFFKLNKTPGSPYFIISRSPLLYSFLKLPFVKQIMNNPIIAKQDSYKIKTILYKQGGFLSKPKAGKFTGFDKIKTALNKNYKICYNEAFRYPLMNMLPDLKKQNLRIAPVWEE